MKLQLFPIAVSGLRRLGWLLVLLALAGCGLSDQVARGVPTAPPPTVQAASFAPPTEVLPASAPTTMTFASAPDSATPTAQTSAATPAVTPIIPPMPGATKSTPQAALPRLAFRSNGLYIVDADGANLRRLTTDPQDQLPAWSPDGQRIVFTSDRDHIGNIDIFVINADGTRLVQLTTDRAVDNFPIWSPDGRYIAFTSNRDPNTPYGDIYIMRADGTQVQRVTTDPTFENIMGWSPDGTRIFYSINHDGAWTIHTVNLDGTHDIVIVAGSAGVLSSDGTAIAFIRTDLGHDDLWISAIDGTNVWRVTNTPSLEYSLAWSPNTKRIAFNPGLSLINTDGTGQSQLSDPQTSTGEIHWSPDGKYIAFQSMNAKDENDLAVVDVTTGVRTLLTHNMNVEAGFAWSPQ
ncbi:MAG: hypothetical protein ACJ8CR_10890 [Roseiflexaceae bacterium]